MAKKPKVPAGDVAEKPRLDLDKAEDELEPATDPDNDADPEGDEGQSDDEIIADAKAYLQFCLDTDNGNRAQAVNDLQFLNGDQWDSQAKRARERDGRPCLTINKLPTFLHQVTNDQRQNVCSIKVSPVDDKADVEVAKIMQGTIRHIEYASNADIAYDTAVNSAAAIGQGYFRLITDYCRPDSFDQEIKFKRIRNPLTVYFDPASEEPDGSDAKRCMITGKVSKGQFQRENPGAQVTTEGFAAGIGDKGIAEWIWDDFIRVAEFYRIEYTPDTLIELTNGEVGYQSKLLEMPPGVSIARSRPTQRQKLMWYKLTAIEVLERTEIMCQWIPVFPIYGDEIDIDGKVYRSGLVRNAKDPARMYNYWMTSATEEVALRTKTPFIGAEGQFEGYEEDWSQANVRSLPYLEYKPTMLDGALAPPPQRQQMTDVPIGVLRMSEHANDNIKATTGLFDSSLGARGTATSGIQERAQQRQGDLANFHYTDNRNRSVRQAGRCLISMIPHYYDAPRIVRVMGEDGKIEFAEINKPLPPEEQKPDPKTGAIKTILNDMTVGEYDLTVSVGPSYNTLRQEAAESMTAIGEKWPKLMDIAGDKVIRAMDWPGADDIADRVKRSIPPALLGDEAEGADDETPMVQTPRGPIPLEQAAQMLEEMDQQIQQIGKELDGAKSGLEKARIDAESRERVAEINAVSRSDVEELKGVIQLLVAKLNPPPVLVADALTQGDGAKPAGSQPVDQGPASAGSPLESVPPDAEMTAPPPAASLNGMNGAAPPQGVA